MKKCVQAVFYILIAAEKHITITFLPADQVRVFLAFNRWTNNYFSPACGENADS